MDIWYSIQVIAIRVVGRLPSKIPKPIYDGPENPKPVLCALLFNSKLSLQEVGASSLHRECICSPVTSCGIHLDPSIRPADSEANSVSGHIFWPDTGAAEELAGYRVWPDTETKRLAVELQKL